MKYETVFWNHGSQLHILYRFTYRKNSFYVPTEIAIAPNISTVHLLGNIPRKVSFDPTPFDSPHKWYGQAHQPNLDLFKELYFALGLLKPRTNPDYVIVGGGISGLYAAWKLTKKGASVTILEKEAHLGGRTLEVEFEGALIKTGAGVGRLSKDTQLMELMHHFGIATPVFKSNPLYVGFKPVNLPVILKKLSHAVSARSELQTLTFKEAATQILGKEAYIEFVTTTGYTDYEATNVMDALTHYGFDDVFPSNSFFVAPWTQLTQGLTKEILAAHPHNRILTKCKVTEINLSHRQVLTSHPAVPHCTFQTQLILALPLTPLQKLLHRPPKMFGSQPFLRVYARIASPPPIGETLISDSPLRKISHIRDNIYMIAYCDNEDARYLRTANTHQLEAEFARATGFRAKFSKVLRIYWPEGTHYTKEVLSSEQLKKIQTSIDPRVLLVGELFSQNQGWVHGALESVDRIVVST